MTIENKQRNKCAQYNATFTPAPMHINSGIALDTIMKRPIHGLRHPVTNDTTGWYIWCGNYSEAPDFFKPVHTIHLESMLPQAMDLLGLPPGYRFLLTDDFQDIWFDKSLLSVQAGLTMPSRPPL